MYLLENKDVIDINIFRAFAIDYIPIFKQMKLRLLHQYRSIRQEACLGIMLAVGGRDWWRSSSGPGKPQRQRSEIGTAIFGQ